MNKLCFSVHYIQIKEDFRFDEDPEVFQDIRIINNVKEELGINDTHQTVEIFGTPEAFSYFINSIIEQVRYHIEEDQ